MELWKSSKIQSRLYHIWLTLTPPGGGGRYSAQEQVDALLGTEVARCCLQVSTPNFERPYIICHQVSKDYEVFVRLIFSPFFYQVGIFFLTAQWWEEAKYIPEQKASKVGRNEINLTNQSNVALYWFLSQGRPGGQLLLPEEPKLWSFVQVLSKFKLQQVFTIETDPSWKTKWCKIIWVSCSTKACLSPLPLPCV